MNRYSRIVGWVKIALPLLALALMSTLFLFSRAPDPTDALPFAEMDVERLAREQRLSQPRFAGTLEDGREIALVAQSATPDGTTGNRFDLVEIEGRMALADGEVLLLSADQGAVSMTERVAALRGAVELLTTSGYRLESAALDLSLDRTRMVSPGAVRATGPGFELDAGAMTLEGNGGDGDVSFTGGVRLLYFGGNEG